MKVTKKTEAKPIEIKASTALERTFNRWRDAVSQFKIWDAKKDAAAAEVTAAIVAGGADVIISKKWGEVPLRYSETNSCDVEKMLKDMGLTDEAIAEKIEKYTKKTKSKAFVKAPATFAAIDEAA